MFAGLIQAAQLREENMRLKVCVEGLQHSLAQAISEASAWLGTADLAIAMECILRQRTRVSAAGTCLYD